MTARLFPEGPVDIDQLADPECPEESFYVFNVSSPLPLVQVVDQQCRWHGELRSIAPEALNLYRLSVRSLG